MAVDTAQKRHSALLWGLPFRTPPRPSGAVDKPERQAAALVYSGIATAALEVPIPHWPQDSNLAGKGPANVTFSGRGPANATFSGRGPANSTFAPKKSQR